MNQPNLFSESLAEALEETVNQLGGMKVVGLALWPSKSAKDAATALRDALDPSRRDKLGLEEIEHIFRMAREAGVLAPWKYMADKYDLELRVVDPADKKAALQREFIDGVNALQALGKRLEGMQ